VRDVAKLACDRLDQSGQLDRRLTGERRADHRRRDGSRPTAQSIAPALARTTRPTGCFRVVGPQRHRRHQFSAGILPHGSRPRQRSVIFRTFSVAENHQLQCEALCTRLNSFDCSARHAVSSPRGLKDRRDDRDSYSTLWHGQRQHFRGPRLRGFSVAALTRCRRCCGPVVWRSAAGCSCKRFRGLAGVGARQ
jgi:hypothetical protein